MNTPYPAGLASTVSIFKELRKEELELPAQSIDDAVDGGRSWHPLDAGAFRGRYLS